MNESEDQIFVVTHDILNNVIIPKLATFNKKAARFHMTPLQLNFIPIHWVDHPYNPGPTGVQILSGFAPKIDGWTLLAKVEHHRDSDQNLIHKSPNIPEDATIDPQYRTRRYCDHCNTSRYRTSTVLLTDESGTVKQVGRNCLADFLRDPQMFLNYLTYWGWREQLAKEIDEELRMNPDGPGTNGTKRYETRYIVALACTAIREYGFMSAKKQREVEEQNGPEGGPVPITTKDRIITHINEIEHPHTPRRDEDILNTTPDDYQSADAALAWLATTTDESDYMHNLRMLCLESMKSEGRLAVCEAKHFGYVASLAAAHDRAMQKEIVRKERAAALPDSAYVGDIGQRIELPLTVKRLIEIDHGIGFPKTLVKLRDDAGNDFAWFSSSWHSNTANEGDKVMVRGTVKKHEEYRERKQTVLTRCKILEVIQ